MKINGRWFTETEAEAYVIMLENKIAELQEKHWQECRQIAEYDNDMKILAKEIEKEKSRMGRKENPTFPYNIGYMDALTNTQKRINFFLHEKETRDALTEYLANIRLVDRNEVEIE